MSSGGRKCGDFQGRALSGVFFFFFLGGIDTFFNLKVRMTLETFTHSSQHQNKIELMQVNIRKRYNLLEEHQGDGVEGAWPGFS